MNAENWIKHTKKHIPEVIQEVYNFEEHINTPMQLWIELKSLFDKAVKEQNEDLICRIFQESRYCLIQEDTNMQTAVALFN